VKVSDITGKKDPPKHPALVSFSQFAASLFGGIASSLTITLLFPEVPKWAACMFATVIFGIIETQFKIEKIQKKLDCE